MKIIVSWNTFYKSPLDVFFFVLILCYYSLIELPTVNVILGSYRKNLAQQSLGSFVAYWFVFKGFLDQIPTGPLGFWPILMATDNTFKKYHWRIWNYIKTLVILLLV